MNVELPNQRCLTVEQLRSLVTDGGIDTVVVAGTDMQGRLQGKRMHAAYFLEHVLDHGAEGCSYLLAADVDMNTVDGYALSSWEQGYGDLAVVLDLATLRRLAHLPAPRWSSAIWPGSTTVRSRLHPGTVLKRQLATAAERGFTVLAGTELEFVVFADTFEQAWDAGYRGLRPANQDNVDYSVLGTTRVEPLLRDIRNTMYAAGMDVESAKGECNLDQHEIGFLYAEALIIADNHAVYTTAAKEIAAQHGQSLTFMAKVGHREGNSCHIHLSLRGRDGETLFWTGTGAGGGRSPLYDHFIAGVLGTLRDFTLLYAPNVNSYKRFADGSFAPTTIAWGEDNRTCAVRLVGHGAGARLENRVPGGDVNPYLALAAMLAGGLHGIEHEWELEPPLTGNAYTSGRPTVPRTLREARDAFAGSAVARELLGEDVVEHYTTMADVELATFDAAVTDWELRRGFERL